MIVRIEAKAESIKQIHCASAGTSGIKEAINKKAEVAAPKNIPDPEVPPCIII